MADYGDRFVVVKPEPGAYSAVMETYVGQTLTFSKYDKGPGGKIHAYLQETGEVPFDCNWLQPAVARGYYYGYDHQKKQTVIFDVSDRTLLKMFQAQDRAKLYKDIYFEVYRDDDVRRGIQVDARPKPWGNLKAHEHLITANIHDEKRAYTPGEVHFIVWKKRQLTPFKPFKVDFKIDPKTGWGMKAPTTGRLTPGVVGNTPKDKKPSLKDAVQKELGFGVTTYEDAQKPPQGANCNCSGHTLLHFGCKCGWAARNGKH